MKPLEPKDWDRDKVWDNIDKVLRKKKRRRGFLLFWLGSGTLAIALALFLWQDPHTFTQLYQSSEEKQNIKASKIQILESKSTLKKQELSTSVINQPDSIPSSFTKVGEAMKTIDQPKHFTTIQTQKPQSDFYNQKQLQQNFEDGTPNLVQANIVDTMSTIPLKDNTQTTIPKARAAAPYITGLALDTLEWGIDADFDLKMDTIYPKALNRLFFRLESGLGLGNVAHNGSELWETAKNNSETFEYAMTNTIGLDWYFSKNLYAYTGLTYQLIRSTYDFTSNQVTTNLVESDSASVYEIDGETFYEPGILLETTTTSRSIIHNNALHRFSIPVGLGITKSLGRVQLEARAGLRFQISQQFDGIALEEFTNQHILDNDISNGRYFRNDTNIGFSSAILLNYQIKPKSYLIFGVQHERDQIFQNLSSDFQSTYNLWNIQIGWKKGF